MLSGGNLVLQRRNGRKLVINGYQEDVPSGGVSLAATGLTAGTTYYIYAYMSGSTMTLEASATSPATGTDGITIKTGDSSRTLVGMARPVSGPAWVDSATQRFVRSYFNRQAVVGRGSFTANRTTTSTSYVELNTEIRVEFLIWEDEGVLAAIIGPHFISSATAAYAYTSVAFDGTTAEGESMSFVANYAVLPVSYTRLKTGLSVGYHYATVVGKVSGQTGQWGANSSYPQLDIGLGASA